MTEGRFRRRAVEAVGQQSGFEFRAPNR